MQKMKVTKCPVGDEFEARAEGKDIKQVYVRRAVGMH